MENNLLIKGDSKEKLLELQEKYINKIDMIYIDPPYNTNRIDMQYHDKRDDDEFIDLLKKTFLNSYKLLKETGNIFISIPSKNSHIIRNILDDIYGSQNYHATIIRKENAKKQKIGKTSLKENYELVIVYSKNKKKSILYNIIDEDYQTFQNQILTLQKQINKLNEINEIYIDDFLNLKTNSIDLNILKTLKNIWNISEKNSGLKQYKYVSNKEV